MLRSAAALGSGGGGEVDRGGAFSERFARGGATASAASLASARSASWLSRFTGLRASGRFRRCWAGPESRRGLGLHALLQVLQGAPARRRSLWATSGKLVGAHDSMITAAITRNFSGLKLITTPL